MIIDAHNHLGARRTDDEDTLFAGVGPDEFLQMLDESGISHSVIFPLYDRYGDYNPGNETVREAFATHPDRLTGLFRVDPHLEHQSLDDVERALKEQDFRGLKIHPRSERTFIDDDEFMDPLIEISAASGWPVLVHTGEEQWCRPYMLYVLARRHPEATFVMGHSGQGAFREGLWTAQECSNIYMETSTLPHQRLIAILIDDLGPERVLFGTDVPFRDPRVELFKIELLDLPNKTRELFMGDNAARLWDIGQ